MIGRLHALVEDAAREAGCTVAQMLGGQQRGGISAARHAAMARAHEEGYSTRQIGAAFNKDHKAVVYALKKMRQQPIFTLSAERRKAIHNRDGYACAYCGTYTNIGIDHVFPQSRGGGNSDDNLVTCCLACNSRKGDRTPEEWLG